MDNPETNRLLEARDRKARRDYMTALGLFTGGSGIMIGATGGVVPTSLVLADWGVVFSQAGNSYSVDGFNGLVPNMLGVVGGKSSAFAAKATNFHRVVPPLLEFSVPKAWDGAVESIESRKDD
ncbi:hypothetical protein [Alcanivorax sp.]|uniref:hypothetical protein n=1 Tax=Alcanivorax sp. TaxID=1872427 RepID=UPI003A8E49A1